MANINQAYQWAVNTCNAKNVGYSQSYRNQQTVNGITYYDCSSFIWYALKAGGFDVVTASGSSSPFTTATMGNALINLGFTKMSPDTEWLPGDILLVRNSQRQHTEMVYNGRRTMGAHTNKYELDKQVSINDYDTDTSYYQYLYRYGAGASASYNWIYGNRYLDETEMQNNAYIFYSIMSFRGWTLNAISGTLGNIEAESTINPGVWQNLSENPSLGFGLVQWTPSTNYTDWANANGYAIDDGDYQCKWIDENSASSGQWIQTGAYPISFEDFKVSGEAPEYLASAFLKNFERAGVEVEEKRRTNARKWYDYLIGMTPISPSTPTGKRRKMPIWMMCKRVI